VKRNRKKSAIAYLLGELPEWVEMAEREMSDEATREIGEVRLTLIQGCRKTLELMKWKELT
jgi:hypothetical protein